MTASIPTLASQYDSAATEAKWQQAWEENQVFKADPDHGGEPFTVVIPPPNVTGSLHMGHAFEMSLIDAVVRYQRMLGKNTLWLPGTDHASIAVQTILERELREQGKHRDDVGREAFLQRAWEWKAESGGKIVGQLRRLGVSVDWTRERFTMDEGLSAAVLTAFKQLYQEGLIYRGKYMVNWCPASQSAVSDLEVENKEVNGHLWHFRYPLTDGSGFVEVATTRPETMLGDTAVAVNPNDDRYKHLVGKTLMLPLMNREIPIIADDYVDASFGTGCVKITPAHDLNDFEMGKRHNLPMINILNKDGTLNENAGEFQGQDRFVARKNVVSRLEAEGFLVKVEDHKHTVPYSDRGKVPIEPLLSTQWFVKIRPLADRALEFLDQRNDPVFLPDRWTKVYRDWLVSLRDWCISRQLWWGHQIPAWYAISETNGEITDDTPFVVATSEAEAREQAIARFGAKVQLVQDPDVLDTWFSSGLWPFSTLGWPEQTRDLETYYPTTTLVTGFDIIFFWVARMTMMAGHFTGKMPFQTVYIHGLVRDENGKKMSKSANNGIDPLLLINKYSTDALRFTLTREVAGAGQDISLEYDRRTDESTSVEASRNFTNKIWNASRFVMLNLEGQTPAQLGAPKAADLELADRWILSRYHQVVQQTRSYLDNYGLGEAAKGLYEFFWGDFCDWYIELVKSRLQQKGISGKVAQQVLAQVLEGTLRLLHPFLPHVTEEVWHTLTQASSDTYLALQAYPTADPSLIDADLDQQFEQLISTIRAIRNLRAEAGVKPGIKIQTILETESEREREIFQAGQTYIQDLAKVERLTIAAPAPLVVTGTGKPVSAPSIPQPLAANRTAADEINWREKPVVVLLMLVLLGGIALNIVIHLLALGKLIWDLTVAKKQVTVKPRRKPPTLPPTTITVASTPVTELPQPARLPSASAEQLFAGVVGTTQVLIPLAGVVDVEALKTKLQKDMGKAEAEIQSLTQRLNNPKFVDKAPADVVQNARDALAEAQKQSEILRDRLDRL
ncbi:valine--tRNA ligase [Phormidium tenue FACHB-886]|nr:valine--tRNA ligase [Phormidium tenue FACHB-886]